MNAIETKLAERNEILTAINLAPQAWLESPWFARQLADLATVEAELDQLCATI